jgi:hypothetical protein
VIGTVTTTGTGHVAYGPGNSVRPKGERLSDEIRKIEEENEMLCEEFVKMRALIFAIRGTLGMERPTPGVSMKLSTALKELGLEIEKRSDIFGNIDPTISL